MIYNRLWFCKFLIYEYKLFIKILFYDSNLKEENRMRRSCGVRFSY